MNERQQTLLDELRPPEPIQLREIAKLSSILGIREPHVGSFKEAGRMIQELYNERTSRLQRRKSTGSINRGWQVVS